MCTCRYISVRRFHRHSVSIGTSQPHQPSKQSKHRCKQKKKHQQLPKNGRNLKRCLVKTKTARAVSAFCEWAVRDLSANNVDCSKCIIIIIFFVFLFRCSLFSYRQSKYRSLKESEVLIQFGCVFPPPTTSLRHLILMHSAFFTMQTALFQVNLFLEQKKISLD